MMSAGILASAFSFLIDTRSYDKMGVAKVVCIFHRRAGMVMMKVVIRECATNRVVKEVECKGKDEALVKEREMNIGLDHEQYYTEIMTN